MEVASHFSQRCSREHKRSKELRLRNTYKQGIMLSTSNQDLIYSSRALELAPQGSGCDPKSVSVQGVFGKHSQIHGLTFGLPHVESGIGLGPCGSLLTEDILQFYLKSTSKKIMKSRKVQALVAEEMKLLFLLIVFPNSMKLRCLS